MFFLSLEKIPLIILGLGLITSFALPGTPALDSPKFLCIYFCTITACFSFMYQVFRHGTSTEFLLGSLITVAFIVMLPVIKMHFSY